MDRFPDAHDDSLDTPVPPPRCVEASDACCNDCATDVGARPIGPSVSGAGASSSAAAVLVHACRRAAVSRWLGRKLFACGDFLLEVRARLERNDAQRTHTC